MQRDDRISAPNFDLPEQTAVINNEDPVIDTRSYKDCQKTYSTRKRRSAPRRYSPSPSWERWESWKDCAAFSGGKNPETANLAESQNHKNGAKEDKLRPRNFSPTPSPCNAMETAVWKTTKLSVLSVEKKKIRKRPLSPAPSYLKKTKDKFLSAASADPRMTEGRPLSPADTNPTHCKAAQNESTELKAKFNARSKRKLSRKILSDAKEKKIYGTRTKRSAPKRYSPTHLSDRKLSFYLEVGSASRARSITPAADISESISVKWASVLKRNPFVLLERYVPPSSPLPHCNEEEFVLDDGSGSECCTPTPSWMDEEEMASYYNSEMVLNIGRCSPSASLGRSSVSSEQGVVDYDRSSYSPLLNDVAIAPTSESETGKCSATLALTSNSIDTGVALEDEFDTGTCSPIPSLDVNAILTSLENDFDLGKCSRPPLLYGNDMTDKDRANTAICTSHLMLNDSALSTIPKTGLCSTVSFDEIAAAATEKNGPGLVSSLGDTAGTTENTKMNQLGPVPVFDDSAEIVPSENNELSPAPCLGDTADAPNEKEELIPVQSLNDIAFISIEEKEMNPVPSSDDTFVGTSGKTELTQVPSLDDTAVNSIEEKHLSNVPSFEGIAVAAVENKELIPLSSLDDTAAPIEKEEPIPLPSLNDTSVDASGKTELTPVPSLYDTAVTSIEEKEVNPVPSPDDVAIAPIEKEEQIPLSSLDDTAVAPTEKEELIPVASLNDTAVTSIEEKKVNPVPSPDDVAVAPIEKEEQIPLSSLDDTAVAPIEKEELIPVPSLDDTAVTSIEEKEMNPVPSRDDVAVAPIEKEEQIPLSSLDDTAVAPIEKEELIPVPLLDDTAVTSIEEKKVNPVPSPDDVAVAPIEKEEQIPLSSVDDTAVAPIEKKELVPVPSLNDTAVTSIEEKKVNPDLSLDDTAVASIKKKGLNHVPSFEDIAVAAIKNKELIPVPSLGATAMGMSEKKELILVPSVDETAVDVTEKSGSGAVSLLDDNALSSTEEYASCSIISGPNSSIDEAAVGMTERKISGLSSSSNEIAKIERDVSGPTKYGPTAAIVAAAVDKTENSVFICGPSFDDGSSPPKRVPTATTDVAVGDSTVDISFGPILSSDESTNTKTETNGLGSTRRVPSVVMVDASVDTTELFSFSTAIDKTEKNGLVTTQCASTSPLRETVVETIVSDTKKPIGELSLNNSNAIDIERNREEKCGFTPSLNRTRPVTRQHRLNSERSSLALASKAGVRKSLDSTIYRPVVNTSFPVERNYRSFNSSNFSKTIKKESPASKKESLILIRRDYVSAPSSFTPRCSSSSHDYLHENDHGNWENDSKLGRYSPSTRTSENEPVTMNPDLTAEDVFDILFGQKNRGASSPCRNTIESGRSRQRKDRDDLVDSEARCPSALSDASTLTTRETGSPPLSTKDVFEVVGGSKTYNPTLFHHDKRNGSPIPVNAVSPRPRKRPHSPAVSLPERSSPSPTSSTRTLKRRSLSSNFGERFQKPGRSVSSLSLNGYESRTEYKTRKKRSAPKRYSPTAPVFCDETTNSSTEDSFYFDNERKPYATRSTRSAPKRYSPTPFYDAYYYYEHKNEFSRKNVSETGNKSEIGNNRKVRRMSVKSVSRDSLKADDDNHWERFHGSSCTKQCASLTIIRDTPVPRDINDKFRAQKTAPPEVSVADSKIPDAGNGAWASEAIPAQTRFGPYEGRIVPAEVFTSYAWLIRKNGKPDRCVDATEPGLSNWMRFVNCARHDGEQNLEAFQCHGNIYYKTTRQVNPHEELLVWYGDDYGRQLGIDPKVCDEEDEESWREKNFKCPGCPFAFASPLYLQSHKRVCRVLKFGAGSSKESKDTLKSKKKPSPVKVRKSNSQSDLTINNSVKSCPGPMQLEPSGRAWNKISRKNQTGDGGYFCVSCNVHFLRKYHWERHLESKKHGANEPYACSHCNKTFRAKFSLTRHMKIHTGEAPFSCPECNRRFSDRGNLKKHVDNHIVKKHFVCPHCKMKFSEKGSLNKHYNRKHNKNNNDRFACNLCKKRYCDKQSLRRHQRIHNGEKPFACFVCNKRFSRREVLKTHLKIHRIGAS